MGQSPEKLVVVLSHMVNGKLETRVEILPALPTKPGDQVKSYSMPPYIVDSIVALGWVS
jgi:hypothetical protein